MPNKNELKCDCAELVIFCLQMALTLTLADSSTDLINGHNLIVAASNFPMAITTQRNSSGHIVSMDGISPQMLNWMSLRFNFSYSILQVSARSFDRVGNLSGLDHYLNTGECDLVMGAIGMLYSRFASVDFSQSYVGVANAFMIPMPVESLSHYWVVIEPFQSSVWIGLMTALVFVSILLYLSASFPKREFWRDGFLLYVTNVLLSQGLLYPDKRLAVRVLIGAWCLTCFVLVTSYNSVLISFVTSPDIKPLISSIHDLNNSSRVHLVVDKGLGSDLAISSVSRGMFKPLADKLSSYKNSRCVTTDACVKQVKSGGHVYLNNHPAVLQAMKKDFQLTSNCNLALLKANSNTVYWTWALRKRSPFTDIINKGILEMRDAGLVDHWMKWYLPDAHQCLAEAEKIQKRKHSKDEAPKQITLDNLKSIFIVLIIGYLCSLLVFLFEKCFHLNKLMSAKV